MDNYVYLHHLQFQESSQLQSLFLELQLETTQLE